MRRRFIVVTLLLALGSAACTTPAGSTPTATPSATSTVAPTATSPATPEAAAFDPASVAGIDVAAFPVLPTVSEQARAIFAASRAADHNPRIFSKIGDCMTAAPAFLTPFGGGDYTLGEYGSLQSVVDFFGGVPARGEGFALDSFANPGLAAASGYNVASVHDPTWADPNWCRAGESPLDCEYRVSRPGLAIIMFGTNDAYYLEAAQFDHYLRQVVEQSIASDVLPVLSTFPGRPEYPEKSLLFNQIIIQIALDHDLPLINLWLALQDLPDGGINLDETIHLTVPEDGRTGVFDEAHLQAGYTVRNLITLQALQALQQQLGLNAG